MQVILLNKLAVLQVDVAQAAINLEVIRDSAESDLATGRARGDVEQARIASLNLAIVRLDSAVMAITAARRGA